MIFFTSDTHFNHANILRYCPGRVTHIGSDSIEDHNEWLIKVWNDKVGPKDRVFHMGDFALGRIEDSFPILDRLNGRKFLISGNHDVRHLKSAEFRSYWEKIYFGYFEIEIKLNGKTTLICMCHYPLQTWNKAHYGSLCLHGHVHQNKVPHPMKNLVNVGVDHHPWLAPFSKEELFLTVDDVPF